MNLELNHSAFAGVPSNCDSSITHNADPSTPDLTAVSRTISQARNPLPSNGVDRSTTSVEPNCRRTWEPLRADISFSSMMDSSQRDSFFGGPSRISTSNQVWSKYHALDGGNIIREQNHDDLKSFGSSTDNEERLQKAAEFGMIAGKLYITFKSSRIGIGNIALSGFWMEEDFFVTCGHFFGEDVSLFWREKAMKDLKIYGSDAEAYVSSSIIAKTQENSSSRRVLFLGRKMPWDVAMFYVPDEEKVIKGSSNTRSCQFSDLEALSSPPPQSPIPVWTVAYCASDSEADQTLRVNFRSNDMGYHEFVVRQKPYFTRYQLLAAKHQDSYKQKFANSGDRPPEFDVLYLPNTRALAVGEFHTSMERDVKTYEKDIPAFPGQAVDRDEDNYANTGALCGKHTISGFHGSSGAPIARLKECDNGMVGSPAIIGLFRGSADNFAFNTYTAFTPEILQWMNELMTKCSAEGKRPANYPMVNSSLAA